ncbi:WecB/TagA/CpsF family glycosyltransferase [bacterium]|nr:WecB/TagA/CpsF family glycosyltransferase [bacterium]MCK5602206.1 WecB/TagA/CpsF family glycosyltransferase [Candidatus Pacearchaeota archaeon]
MNRVKISDIFIDNLEWNRIADVVEKFIGSQKAQQIITANSLMVNSVERDPELRGAFHNAGLVLADSIGIVRASEFLGHGKLVRVPGIELMLKFCQLAASKDYSIYLLGSREFVLKKAGENLREKFPGLIIAGMHHGYFTEGEHDRILKEIKNLKPHFLFVGIGTPRGEKWIYQNLEELNVPVCMGIGGSLDVISGRLRRAPRWLCQRGFEWTYRLLQEPWRVVRLPGLLCFVWKVIKQKLRR